MRDGFKSLQVIQSKDEKLSGKVIATEIQAIANALKVLTQGGLTEDAIVVLVHAAVPKSFGVSERTVRAVLFEGLTQLEKKYLK